MEHDEYWGNLAFQLALNLCGLLADKGVITMTEIADKVGEAADECEARGDKGVPELRAMASSIRRGAARAIN